MIVIETGLVIYKIYKGVLSLTANVRPNSRWISSEVGISSTPRRERPRIIARHESFCRVRLLVVFVCPAVALTIPADTVVHLVEKFGPVALKLLH